MVVALVRMGAGVVGVVVGVEGRMVRKWNDGDTDKMLV